MFITVFTRGRHFSLSWARWIRSTPSHTTSLTSVLTLLSSHLRLGLPHGLFPSDFPTKILYAFLISPVRSTFPTNLLRTNWNTVPHNVLKLRKTTKDLSQGTATQGLHRNDHCKTSDYVPSMILRCLYNGVWKLPNPQVVFFWVLMPCNNVVGYRRFGGPCWPNLDPWEWR